MRYRLTEDGPEHEIVIEPGAVVITIRFDLPGQHLTMHSHAVSHLMKCKVGALRLTLNGNQRILRPGDTALVEPHENHDLWALTSDAVAECRHVHADIHPDRALPGHIPLEWLDRLTDRVV